MKNRKSKTSNYLEPFNSRTLFEFKNTYDKQQKQVINFLRSNSISIITGDPGTGKTFLALHYALSLYKETNKNKIILSKPLVEIGKTMGYLPGKEDEKYAPYLDSYIDTIHKLIGPDATKALINSKDISFEPINFVRGKTYEYSIVIVDEAQNCTIHELISIMTRLSDTSILILLGDLYQSDIKNSGLFKTIDLLKNINGIDHMELGDEYQRRSPFIINIYKKYKEYLDNNNN
jgi:phosphate starvation-inducible PhoH-like protein